MTEGIIQQVFNKYYKECGFQSEIELLESLQQELIEKIKKEFGYYYIGNTQDMKRKLIGDDKDV